jgi:hypothetical protein
MLWGVLQPMICGLAAGAAFYVVLFLFMRRLQARLRMSESGGFRLSKLEREHGLERGQWESDEQLSERLRFAAFMGLDWRRE